MKSLSHAVFSIAIGFLAVAAITGAAAPVQTSFAGALVVAHTDKVNEDQGWG